MARRNLSDSVDVAWLYSDPQSAHDQASHRPARDITSCKRCSVYAINGSSIRPGKYQSGNIEQVNFKPK